MNRADKADRELLQAVGEHIRELRLEMGLSQEQVALAAGITRAYYSGVERGMTNITLLSLRRIAATLGVEVAVLLPPIGFPTVSFPPLGAGTAPLGISQLSTSQGSTIPGASPSGIHSADIAPSPTAPPDKRAEELPSTVPSAVAPASDSAHESRHEQMQEQHRKKMGDDVKRRWRRPVKTSERQATAEKKATLISAGVVAQMCNVNRRTIARWVEAGIVPVAEYVEDSYGTLAPLFRRDDIARHASALRQSRSEESIQKQEQG